jgi:hypothetical protein
MPSGGDIIEITYNHPTLGTGVLLPKSSEDSTYDNGGFRTADDATSIQANGDSIYMLNRTRPSFQVKVGWDMVNRQDLEILSALTSDPAEATWTFANVNGVIYQLKGKQVGDLNGNGNDSTIDLKIAGSGTMSIIS